MEKKCYLCGAPMHRQGQMCDACLDRAKKMMEKAIFPKELNEHRKKKAVDSEELERLLYLTREEVFGGDEYDEDYEDEEFDDEEYEDFDKEENEEGIVLNIRIPYGCREITINIEEE